MDFSRQVKRYWTSTKLETEEWRRLWEVAAGAREHITSVNLYGREKIKGEIMGVLPGLKLETLQVLNLAIEGCSGLSGAILDGYTGLSGAIPASLRGQGCRVETNGTSLR